MATALAVLAVVPALAAGSSLTITNLICPADYSGTNYAGDCTKPLAGAFFQAQGPAQASGTTDANGVVALGGLSAGTYTVTGGAPGDFARLVIACSSGGADFPVTQNGVVVTMEIPVDAQIRCTWWNIPESGRGPPDTATTDPAPAAWATIVTLLGAFLLLGSVGTALRRPRT